VEKLQALQTAAREGGFVQVEECDEGTVLWLRKKTSDAPTRTSVYASTANQIF
jgi:hypothetical protein